MAELRAPKANGKDPEPPIVAKIVTAKACSALFA